MSQRDIPTGGVGAKTPHSQCGVYGAVCPASRGDAPKVRASQRATARLLAGQATWGVPTVSGTWEIGVGKAVIFGFMVRCFFIWFMPQNYKFFLIRGGCVLLHIVALCCAVMPSETALWGDCSRTKRGISPMPFRFWQCDGGKPLPVPIGNGWHVAAKCLNLLFLSCFCKIRGLSATPSRCRRGRRSSIGRACPTLAALRPIAAECHFSESPTCEWSARG